MHSALVGLAVGLGLGVDCGLRAQQARIDEIQPRFSAAARGSAPWFDLGFEMVEAQMDTELRDALATARDLVHAAQTQAPPGCLQAAHAFVALCLSLLEGPALATDACRAAAKEPPADTASKTRTHYLLARSRQAWAACETTQELMLAVDGRDAARDSGDPVLEARAALVLFWAGLDDNTEIVRAALEDVKLRVAVPQANFLAPWALLYEHLFYRRQDQAEPSLRARDALEASAKQYGNPRLTALAHVRRGRFAYHERADDEAVREYQAARAWWLRVGDRLELAHTIEFEADIEVRRGRLERAAALVAETRALIAGRGLPSCENGIAETHFNLAVKQRDVEVIAKLAKDLEHSREAADRTKRHLAPIRERLARAERERLAAEVELRAANLRSAERTRMTWVIGSIGVAAALAALSVLTLRSRHKLVVANERLRQEMARAAQAHRAQACAEERMRQLERTESVGMLASGIAHDFNNLLTCMLGSAELLASGEPDANRRALVSTITAAGQQAARMCRQLQAYNTNLPASPLALDVAILLRDVLPVLRAAVGAGVTVAIDARTTTAWALVDRTEIEQVLLNLVVNARDAGANTVTLRAAGEQLDAAQISAGAVRGELAAGDYTVLEVADDGEGMSPQLVARIFDPFFTTRFPGRGLGLAVVYGAVRRHRGGIAVRSQVQRGSCFQIYLPVVRAVAPSPALAPQAPAGEPGRRGTVLVVDDEAGVRRLLVKTLREAGHQVIDAASGATALQSLAMLPADPAPLMLLDLTMPVMDGPEVMRQVRARHPNVPIVLMSGHTSSYLKEMAHELRPDGVLLKPFNLAEVRTLVASVLRDPARQTA
jgi:signal transduction histidine kinase/ActR/RegA family two-component response regulator